MTELAPQERSKAIRKSLKQSLLTGRTAPITPSLIERVFVVAALLLLSRAWSSVMFTGANPGEAVSALNSPLRLSLFLSVYAISGILLLWQWRSALDALFKQKFVLLLMMLALVSPLWSVNPAESIEKVTGIIGCTVFALYLINRFTSQTMLQLLTWAFGIIILGSYLTALVFPSVGLMQDNHQGLWSGAYQHKNLLGLYTVLSGACFFTLALWSNARRGRYLMGFLLSLILLTMTCSKTSLLSWTIVFGILAALLFYCARYRFGAVALAASAIAISSLLLQTKVDLMPPLVVAETIECVENKLEGSSHTCNIIENAILAVPPSSDFTTGQGRVELWGHLWVKIQERPLLGYAPGGFWLGMNGPSAYVWEREPWHPAGGHNGFIDLVVHLGFVGLIVFLLSTVPLVFSIIRDGIGKSLNEPTLVYAAILAALLLGNVGESMLLAPNKLPWVLMIVLTFRLWAGDETPDRQAYDAA